MPLKDYQCKACQHQWESFSNFYNPEPDLCPECKSKEIESIVSFSRNGKVELSGQELREQTIKDAAKLKQELYSSEKKYANVVGEARYEKVQRQMDSARKDRGRR